MRISDWSSDVCSSDLRDDNASISPRQVLKAGAMTAESQQGATGANSAAAAANTDHPGHAHHGDGKLKLAVGAVGVVFGDIGTSPLYAFRETFAGHHLIDPDRLHIYGVLSLVFWSMMLVVTFKYVLTIMKADNKGEGGSLALMALISRPDRKRGGE